MKSSAKLEIKTRFGAYLITLITKVTREQVKAGGNVSRVNVNKGK